MSCTAFTDLCCLFRVIYISRNVVELLVERDREVGISTLLTVCQLYRGEECIRTGD